MIKKTIFLILLAVCSSLFFSGCMPDLAAPVVEEIVPAHQSTGVTARPVISIRFSTEMNQALTERNVTLTTPKATVTGSYRWDGNTLYYDLTNDLTVGEKYTLTVAIGAEDTHGANLAADAVSIFGVGNDFTRPAITSFSPVNGGKVTPYQPVLINFSEPVAVGTLLEGFSLSPTVKGELALSPDQKTITFTPFDAYTPRVHYTVTAANTITDISGNSLPASKTFSFSTNDDGIAPTVQSVTVTTLSSGAAAVLTPGTVTTGLEKNSKLTVVFSKAMSRIDTESAVSISPSVEYTTSWTDDYTLVLTPTANLALDETYLVTVKQSAHDTAANSLAADYLCQFKINGTHSKLLTVSQVKQVVFNQSTGAPDETRSAEYALVTQDSTIDISSPKFQYTLVADADVRYIVRIYFSNGGTPAIDELSAIANLKFSCAAYHGSNSYPKTPVVEKVVCPASCPGAVDVYIRSVESGCYYRLEMSGTKSGITDTDSNYMNAAFLIFFNS